MKVALLTTCLLAALSASARAQDAEADELAALLAVVAEETAIATKTRQNADYVPGIVTVLHAQEAQALGARTVLEALAMVPGVEINRDQTGAATLRVRGLDFFFNGGNVKVLVDSMPFSRETAFQNSGILLMPLAQVERIEVIRGPGASVHGDYAFVGLVNIVTRKGDNALALGAGSGARRSAVWTFHGGPADGSGDGLSGSLASWRSGRYDGPGRGPVDEGRGYGAVEIRRDGWQFKAAGLDRQVTVRTVGVTPSPPPPGAPPPPPPPTAGGMLMQVERNTALELRRGWDEGADLRRSAWISYQGTDFELGNNAFQGHRWELGADHVRRYGAHLLLLQASVGRATIDDARAAANQRRAALRGIDEARTFLSALIEDQIDLGERFALTGGLRYDRLQGIDDIFTPRIAGLWRIDDAHTLKAQYARGYRSPHYIEMYGGGAPGAAGIPFERIATYELAYVYRAPDTLVRITWFDSHIDRMIFPRDTPSFRAGLELDARGWEVEASHQFTSSLKAIANWSSTDTWDGRGLGPLTGSGLRTTSSGQADYLANLGLIARAGEHWTLGLHWNRVGERFLRTRPEPGYDLVNFGASYRFPRWPAWSLQFGVHNLLDDDIVHIAFEPVGARRLNYAERQYSAELRWNY